MPVQSFGLEELFAGLIEAFGGSAPYSGGLGELYNDLIIAVNAYTNSGVQGPQGHQGSQGAVGTQGAQGAQGSQGAAGAQGAQGFQGAQGAQAP